MKQIMAIVFVVVFLFSGVGNADLIASYSFTGNANDVSGNGLDGVRGDLARNAINAG